MQGIEFKTHVRADMNPFVVMTKYDRPTDLCGLRLRELLKFADKEMKKKC